MAQLIKTFRDGSTLEYDRGQFDDWCVYLTRPGVARYAPRDFQYFDRLKRYAQATSARQVYSDFVDIYNRTTKDLDAGVLAYIETISVKYGNSALDIAIDFTIIYMGMIAEENKAHAILKKRVKRLGVHQVLIDGFSPMEAARFSFGKKWRDLDVIMKQKGF